ncbi:MAG: aminotransferase class III-fold pyridoxal phosphate-dependent enzyme, partial [Planctomycetes bacterium]|nr:aminotransferase class III-fold pyridoxal phosphate-dependent enzyme [Planctomycetota bacterium]
CKDLGFDVFLQALRDQHVQPEDVAGVLVESFQGGDANFAPAQYVRQLAEWCREHDAVLTMDEIQAGFGRTGKLFGFEHYGVVPDLACFAKGMSGSLPLSAVMGRQDLLDGFPPRSMTTTFGGHPVCAAAALANLELIINEGLPARAEKTGRLLHTELEQIAARHPEIAFVHGRGLVAAVHFVKPGTTEPDPDLAFRIVESCVLQGLMLFAPVGWGAASIKICPPLIIEEDAVREGAELLAGVIENEKGVS